MNKIICDEVIDIKEKNFNEKKYLIKRKISIFYLFFIKYYNIIDSC